MRAKILIALMLAAVCAASNASITSRDDNNPNGKPSFAFVGDEQDERLNAALNNLDPQVVDDIKIVSVTIENIKRIFDVYGKQTTKLTFDAGNLTYNVQDIFDALNMLPNLEELKFIVKDSNIEGEAVGTLSLKNLNKLEITHIGSVFLSKILPENILKDLTILRDENYDKLLEKQRSIKDFSISLPDPVFTDAFKNLKLEEFGYDPLSGFYDLKLISNRRNFIKAVIATQPDLKNLWLEFSRNGDTNIINDELLMEISKLSKLEKFMILMEGSGLTNFEPLGNLKSLKTLTPRVYKESSFELLRKLSNVRFESLEELNFYWCYLDLPADILEGLSQNMPNLKIASSPQSTLHTINFFAEKFPQLEELTVRSDSNFDDFHDKNLKVINENLKTLKVVLRGNEDSISVGDFIKILKIYPNLEKLEFFAEFPYTTEFFTKLGENINKLKILKLGQFLPKDFQNFHVETSNAMKEFALKLKFFAVSFKIENPTESDKGYKPLIDQVKDVFSVSFKESYDSPRIQFETGDDGCKNSESIQCMSEYFSQ